MSNIKDAIAQAAHEALKSYLAPDLVEQLTEEIIQRAAPQMEDALRTMAGFEMGRPGTVRQKPTQMPARKLGKVGKPAKPASGRKEEPGEVPPKYLTHGVDAAGLGVPQSDGSMHLS